MGNKAMHRWLIIALTLLFITPITNADSNSLFFESTYDSKLNHQGFGALEINEDGTLGYASFGKTLIQFSIHDKSTIQSKIFDHEILAIALSPDDTRIATTTRDGGTGGDTTYVLDTSTFNTKISSGATGSNADLLTWTDNGASFVTNHPTDGLLKLNREDLTIEAHYTGNVTDSIICADISSSGGYIMGVDDSGRLTIWNSNGDYIYHELILDSSINDCSFDPSESMFAVSINENQIRKWTLSGSELRPLETPGIESYKWSSDGQFVYTHRTNNGQFITTYNSSDSSYVSEIALFHQFSDYALLEEQPGLIDVAIFNSMIDYIVIYDSEHIKQGIGESGSDFDSDGIPNSIDEDDDGDGIEDIWDLNCEASGSFSCALLPDEEFMRSMDLYLNGTILEVKETFTLNKNYSSVIRDLSRYSLDTDVKLSSDEAMLFAVSYCANINDEQYTNSIQNAIMIDGVSLDFLSLSCSISSGMELTQVDDVRTHIRYSITTKYNMTGVIPLGNGYVQILYQPTSVDGSITRLSEQHPMSVSVSGSTYDAEIFSPWFLQEQTITLSLSEKTTTDDSNLVDSSIFSSWWFISIVIISLLSAGLLIYKFVNRADSYSIELDEEEDSDDEEYSDDEDEYGVEDTSFDEIEEIIQPEVRREPPKKMPQRTSKKRTTVARKSEEISTPTRKRRTRATNTDSNVTTAKRRRLVETEEPPKVRKRRAVRQSVDVDDEEMTDALNRYEKN